jgi:hypothetical protein
MAGKIARGSDGFETELLPEGKDPFFVPGSEIELEFMAGATGKFESLAVYRNGVIVLVRTE